MSTIVKPVVSGKNPSIITFNKTTNISDQFNLNISLNEFVPNNKQKVDLIIYLEMVIPNYYRFDNGTIVKEFEFNNCSIGEIKSITAQVKILAFPPLGDNLLDLNIRIIVRDKTSKTNSEKRVTSATFKCV